MPDTVLASLPGADDGLGGAGGPTPGALSEETATISAADIQVCLCVRGWVAGGVRITKRGGDETKTQGAGGPAVACVPGLVGAWREVDHPGPPAHRLHCMLRQALGQTAWVSGRVRP